VPKRRSSDRQEKEPISVDNGISSALDKIGLAMALPCLELNPEAEDFIPPSHYSNSNEARDDKDSKTAHSHKNLQPQKLPSDDKTYSDYQPKEVSQITRHQQPKTNEESLKHKTDYSQMSEPKSYDHADSPYIAADKLGQIQKHYTGMRRTTEEQKDYINKAIKAWISYPGFNKPSPDNGTSWILNDSANKCYVRRVRGGFTQETLSRWFVEAFNNIDWTRPLSRGMPLPRHIAWFTTKGCECIYSYGSGALSRVRCPPLHFIPIIEEMRREVCKILNIPPGQEPDSVNVNLYENGQDCVGWHADDERLFQNDLGDISVVSFSLGAPREFQFRRKEKYPYIPTRTILHPGDLLTMEGRFQSFYEHRIPVSNEVPVGPRINFTWRWLTSHHHQCPMFRSSFTKVAQCLIDDRPKGR